MRRLALVDTNQPSLGPAGCGCWGSRFGVGVHQSIATASVLATLGAFNRLAGEVAVVAAATV